MSLTQHGITSRKRSVQTRILQRFRIGILRRRTLIGTSASLLGLALHAPLSIKLMHMIQQSRNGLARELISAGADVNHKFYRGRTLLMAAVVAGNNAGVSLLLSSGAKVDATNELGQTALMFARSKEVLDSLIASGACIDSTDDFGYSPLMHAAKAGYVGVVSTLVKMGADLSQSAKGSGESALDLARKCLSMDHPCVRVLEQASGPWTPETHALFPPPFRRMIIDIWVVHYRLSAIPTETSPLRSSSRPRQECMKDRAKDGMLQNSNREHVTHHGRALPYLPPEIWRYMVGFLPRESW